MKKNIIFSVLCLTLMSLSGQSFAMDPRAAQEIAQVVLAEIPGEVKSNLFKRVQVSRLASTPASCDQIVERALAAALSANGLPPPQRRMMLRSVPMIRPPTQAQGLTIAYTFLNNGRCAALQIPTRYPSFLPSALTKKQWLVTGLTGLGGAYAAYRTWWKK